MTVLIFIDWFLPAYKAGGPVQTVANLVAQPEKNRQYRIVTSNREWDGSELEVIPDQWVEYNPWTQVYYSSKGTFTQLFGHPEDVLLVNGLYSWQFTVKPLLFAKAYRKIVSPRGMLHPEALAQKSLKKKIYLQAWKWVGLHRKWIFHATDIAEANAIQKQFGPDMNIQQIPNLPKELMALPVLHKKRGSLHLVTVALISPMKNILLVLRALMEVEESITYHLYGPIKDKSYWQRCTAVIATLPSNIQVHYHGDLPPSELTAALQRGEVFILPSQSENFGHAIFEALSVGRPVITSNRTPWNGLVQEKAGININPLKSWTMQEAIRFFAAMDDLEILVWTKGARDYAEAALDRNAIQAQYRELFQGQHTR